jgi:hypothetical protein
MNYNSRPPALGSIPLVRQLASAIESTELQGRFAGTPRGTVRGIVKDVNDPENRGRVKVVFDAFATATPQVTGAGEWSEPRDGQEDLSHWIDVSPAFKGKQPPGLVGKRVNITVTNGEYQYAVLNDVLFDPQNLATGPDKELKVPNNSSMTRLPLYPSGQLPPASAENHGCTVIELDGPMNADWVCVCLRRRGKFLWVRHVDLQHGHAGENDGIQPNDSHGDSEQPVNEQTIWDYVFPTSDRTMDKQTRYGTAPRGNPFGGDATWHSPPS